MALPFSLKSFQVEANVVDPGHVSAAGQFRMTLVNRVGTKSSVVILLDRFRQLVTQPGARAAGLPGSAGSGFP